MLLIIPMFVIVGDGRSEAEIVCCDTCNQVPVFLVTLLNLRLYNSWRRVRPAGFSSLLTQGHISLYLFCGKHASARSWASNQEVDDAHTGT